MRLINLLMMCSDAILSGAQIKLVDDKGWHEVYKGEVLRHLLYTTSKLQRTSL